ncbi:MAG: Lrp/AsnC family transcriptional regulator [Candidatus Micrarchaeota archaeon]|nr:Lrp/AsnC family transcriptional regulator [Candidatus Micrarchaeota archaeon]
MAWKMDEIDRKILEILREDARIANVALGKKVGLSEPAARRRVANLAARGVIRRFTVDVEEGGAVQAIVFVTFLPSAQSEKIIRELSRAPGITALFEISGDTDLVARLAAPDMDELNLRIDALRHHPEITATKTNMVLKKWK